MQQLCCGPLTSAADDKPNQQRAQNLHIEKTLQYHFCTCKVLPLISHQRYFECETCLVTPVGCDETCWDLRACSRCHGRCVVFFRIIDPYYPLHGNFRRCVNPCESGVFSDLDALPKVMEHARISASQASIAIVIAEGLAFPY